MMGAPIHAPEIRLRSSLRDRDLQESVFSSIMSILADFGLDEIYGKAEAYRY